MVRYVSEVLAVVYNYGGVVPRKLHLTGVQYKILRKKTEVERLIVDTTLFIESVRNLYQIEYNGALVNPIFGDDLDCLPNGFIKVLTVILLWLWRLVQVITLNILTLTQIT